LRSHSPWQSGAFEGGQFTAKSRMRQAEFKAVRRVMMHVGNKPKQSDAPGNGRADLVR
jgi:hypothetical protein